MNLVRSILFFLIQFPTLLYAQINWADYSHSFPSGTLKNPDNVGLILAIPKSNNSFWAIKGRSIYFDTFLKDSSFTSVRPLDIVSKTTFDTARAQFFLHGADKNSAALYQFRVMEYPGRKILVPWKSINQFTDSSVISSSGQRQMGYLGGYKTALGRMLIVDLKNRVTSGSSQRAW
jgi:two-component system LytT family sensor kinase